jgi:hypothetical protein
MKTTITAKSFNPTTKVVDFSNIPDFRVDRLLAILNATTGAFLFNISSGARIASVSGSLVTVASDTTGQAATNKIVAIYDDQTAGASLYASVSGAALLQAPDGALRTYNTNWEPCYTASSVFFTPAATPTDVLAFGLASFSRTPVLRRITVRGVSTAGGQQLRVRLQRAVNGGTLTFTSPVVARMDSNDPAPTAAIYQFSVNRGGGLDNGISSSRPLYAEKYMTLGVAGTSIGEVTFDFDEGMKRPNVKQISDWLVLNFDGQTLPSGTQIAYTIEWSEPRLVRIGYSGDSTTSNAVLGLLNGGPTLGGRGTSGLWNSLGVFDNLGTSGRTLSDFVNATGGVGFPLSTLCQRGYDAVFLNWGINDIRTGQVGRTQAGAINRLVSQYDAAIHALINGMTSGQAYVSSRTNSFAIQSMSWSGGTVTVTTTANHDMRTGEAVVHNISGCTPSGYNGAFTCTATGANTFTYPLASDPGAMTVAGSVAFATVWNATQTGGPDIKIVLLGPNAFTSDDAGAGSPFNFLGSPLTGLWSGMTLAQAAAAASDILYQAAAAFVGDARLFAVFQQQDVLGRSPGSVAASGDYDNQIHPGALGQTKLGRAFRWFEIDVMRSVMQNIY